MGDAAIVAPLTYGTNVAIHDRFYNVIIMVFIPDYCAFSSCSLLHQYSTNNFIGAVQSIRCKTY